MKSGALWVNYNYSRLHLFRTSLCLESNLVPFVFGPYFQCFITIVYLELAYF